LIISPPPAPIIIIEPTSPPDHIVVPSGGSRFTPGELAGLIIGVILGFLLLLVLLAFVFRRKIEKYRKQKDVELVLVANQGPAPDEEQ